MSFIKEKHRIAECCKQLGIPNSDEDNLAALPLIEALIQRVLWLERVTVKITMNEDEGGGGAPMFNTLRTAEGVRLGVGSTAGVRIGVESTFGQPLATVPGTLIRAFPHAAPGVGMPIAPPNPPDVLAPGGTVTLVPRQ